MSFVSTSGARVPHAASVDPLFDSVVLLLDGQSFTDLSPYGHVLTNTGTQLLSNQTLFGATSLYFDGASWLEFAQHAALDMGNGDWTVDLWLMTDTGSGAVGGLLAGKTRSPDAGAVQLDSGGELGASGPLYPDRSTVNANVPTGVWTFLAAQRSGTNTQLFVGGEFLIDAPDLDAAKLFDLGNGGTTIGYADIGFGAVPVSANQFIKGWVGGLRVTRGVARYSAAFTPPTAPFPTR